MATQTIYLLTLMQEDYKEPIGRIPLADNDIKLIIKAINKLESSGGDYYESYATHIHIYGDPKSPTDGTYRDAVKYANMSWEIEEMEILK